MDLGQLGLLATAIVVRGEIITVTCVKPISILIWVVSFLRISFLLKIRANYFVAASLFQFHSLLLSQKKAQGSVKVTAWLDYIKNVYLRLHAFPSLLKASFESIRFATLTKADPWGERISEIFFGVSELPRLHVVWVLEGILDLPSVSFRWTFQLVKVTNHVVV